MQWFSHVFALFTVLEIKGARRADGVEVAAGSPGAVAHAETPANTPAQTGTHIPPATGASAPAPAAGAAPKFAFNFDSKATSRFAETLAAGAPAGAAPAGKAKPATRGGARGGDDDEVVEEIDVRGRDGPAGGRGGGGGARGGDQEAMVEAMRRMMAGGGGGGAPDLRAMMAGNPDFLAAIQQQLGGLIGQDSGVLDDAPVVLRRRIRAMKKLQDERITLDGAFNAELSALRIKYEALASALEDKQRAIVTGAFEPTDADLPAPQEGEDDDAPEATEEIVGIPKFWLAVLQNCADIEPHITEKDEQLLAYLIDIRVQTTPASADGKEGFTLAFHFAPNEFIEDAVIFKTYETNRDEFNEENFVSAKGTEIKWKKGKDLTVEYVEVTRRGKKVVTEKDTESFFSFFYPPETPTQEQMREMDPDQVNELQMTLGGDYEMGDVIRARLVPRVYGWFTGENTRLMMEREQNSDFGDGEGMFGDGEYNEDEDEDYEDGGAPPPKCNQQ